MSHEQTTTNSMNLTEERLQQLRSLFPEIFSEGKVDLEKLKLLLGERVETRQERYEFNWAGKREALRLAQLPTRATLVPVREQSVNFDTTQNIFIEGENLEVLKLLLKPYFGRVKMIYIDPPYNTGNDFVYPDDYSDPLGAYLRMTGQVDDNGDAVTSRQERNGRYHSRWLSMMYPRLFLARQLLREDGVIFISIDDGEVHNLRALMNEIFGEENFVACLVWQKKYGPANDNTGISQTHEYVLTFARNTQLWTPKLLARSEEQLAAYKNPDDDPRGLWRASDLSARTVSDNTVYPITLPSGKVVTPPASRSWIVSEKRFQKLVKDKRIWFGVDGNARPMMKKFLTEVKEGITPQTWWDREFAGDNKSARYEMKEIFPENPFDTPKPTDLLIRMLEVATQPDTNDIILDFFAGSCTTAHAVIEQNRRDEGNRSYIVVQYPEPTFRDDFKTIADIGITRLQRVLKREKSQNDGFRVYRLVPSSIRVPEIPEGASADEVLSQLEFWVNNSLVEGWTADNLITEVILKEVGFELGSTIEPVKTVTDQNVFRVTDRFKEQSFYLCLDDKVTADAFRPLKLQPDDLLIVRESATDDDAIVNLALQCRVKVI